MARKPVRMEIRISRAERSMWRLAARYEGCSVAWLIRKATDMYADACLMERADKYDRAGGQPT